MKKYLPLFSLFFFSIGSFLFAQEGEAAPVKQSPFMQTFFILALAIVFFYFILWRPEQKRRKASAQLRERMKKGDKVTAMGIVGTVHQVKDTTVIVTMHDGSKLEFLKAAVTDVRSDGQEETEQKKKKTRRELIEQRIISLILNSPEYLRLLDKKTRYFSGQVQEIIKQFNKNKKGFSKNYLQLDLIEEDKQLLNELALKGEAELTITEIDVKQEIEACLKELEQIFKRQEMQKISEEIKRAEKSGDKRKEEELSEKFNKLAKKLL